jgi:hypothetical protein
MRISTKVTCRPALPNYVSGDDRSPADLILKCGGSNPAAPTSQSVSNAYWIGSHRAGATGWDRNHGSVVAAPGAPHVAAFLSVVESGV